MGLHVTFPASISVGHLDIKLGTDVIRVADGVHHKTTVAAGRPAVPASLTGGLSGPGYICDLSADELHFVRAGVGVTFTPALLPPDPLAIAKAVNAALDHVAPSVAATVAAIAEARPR